MIMKYKKKAFYVSMWVWVMLMLKGNQSDLSYMLTITVTAA